MKTTFFFISFTISCSVSFAQLNGPESIDFDVNNNRYLIANSANGKIMQRASNGTITQFVGGISPNPYGIEVVGTTVYACCSGKVLGFDLTSGQQVFSVNLGATFLNGITHDISGNLFVTDFSAKKIYRIAIATQTFNVFAQNLTQSPNGIIFDEPTNSLVFVNWGSAAKIKKCSLADSSVTTILTTSYTNIDGIARKANGDFFISTWGTNSVYKYNNDFTATPTLIVSGLSSPADIFYNDITDTLAIPNSGNNTLTFVGQSTASVEEMNVGEISIYPNPSLNVLTIKSAKMQIAQLELINESGIVVANYTLDNTLEVNIDVNNTDKGIYFVRLYDNKKILIGSQRFLKVN